jgi:hypothetical protein
MKLQSFAQQNVTLSSKLMFSPNTLQPIQSGRAAVSTQVCYPKVRCQIESWRGCANKLPRHNNILQERENAWILFFFLSASADTMTTHSSQDLVTSALFIFYNGYPQNTKQGQAPTATLPAQERISKISSRRAVAQKEGRGQ